MTREELFREELQNYVEVDGCHLHQGGVMGKEYSSFNYKNRRYYAHRAAYEVYIGPIPPGMWVLHKCHHRTCVNPEHLKLGDHQDNMDDMVEAGRSTPGSAHSCSLLNEEQVAEILQLIAQGGKFWWIAECYGVTRETIGHIAYGRKWTHVPGPRKLPAPPKTNRFFGVYRHYKGWYAQLTVDKKRQKFLGLFGHELLAACCVNAHIAYLNLNKSLNVIDPVEWEQAGIHD